MNGPNVASATGTRLDSAAKHQIAVRASYEHLLSWVGYEQIVLQKEKHAFAIAKDELAIACTRSVRKNVPSRGNQRNKAYPSVVSTLARMEQSAKNYLVLLFHNPKDLTERDTLVAALAGVRGDLEVARAAHDEERASQHALMDALRARVAELEARAAQRDAIVERARRAAEIASALLDELAETDADPADAQELRASEPSAEASRA
jgi:hypothetical protein